MTYHNGGLCVAVSLRSMLVCESMRVCITLCALFCLLQAWSEKLEKHVVEMRNKDENKAVALGTSKINYMDPRITVAWCKRVSAHTRGKHALALIPCT